MNDLLIKVLFYEYRDKLIQNTNHLILMLKRDHNINIDRCNIEDNISLTKLYVMINKYQIKKYGQNIRYNPRDYNKSFLDLSKRKRIKKHEYSIIYYSTNKMLERIENIENN